MKVLIVGEGEILPCEESKRSTSFLGNSDFVGRIVTERVLVPAIYIPKAKSIYTLLNLHCNFTLKADVFRSETCHLLRLRVISEDGV